MGLKGGLRVTAGKVRKKGREESGMILGFWPEYLVDVHPVNRVNTLWSGSDEKPKFSFVACAASKGDV